MALLNGRHSAARALCVVTAWGMLSLVVLPGNSIAQPPPNFAGVWLATSPRGGGGDPIPELTARAAADREAYDPLTDPVIRCVPPGFPRSGPTIYPLEIVQTDALLVIIYETFGMLRHVYMDGRPVPDYLPPSLMGFSRGHWDGDELVIETTNYAPGLLVSDGTYQYGDMTVIERYRLSDSGSVLEGEVRVTAPETFAGSWLRRYTWARDPDGMLFESICDPADSRF
jgi:hypothetical protein